MPLLLQTGQDWDHLGGEGGANPKNNVVKPDTYATVADDFVADVDANL